jgi:hypothetical protein
VGRPVAVHDPDFVSDIEARTEIREPRHGLSLSARDGRGERGDCQDLLQSHRHRNLSGMAATGAITVPAL